MEWEQQREQESCKGIEMDIEGIWSHFLSALMYVIVLSHTLSLSLSLSLSVKTGDSHSRWGQWCSGFQRRIRKIRENGGQTVFYTSSTPRKTNDQQATRLACPCTWDINLANLLTDW